MSAVQKALKLIKDEEVEYVDIRFTDPKGKLQHVTLVSDPESDIRTLFTSR